MKAAIIFFFFLMLMTPFSLMSEEPDKDSVWYKVNEGDDINSIYVDYKSIDRKDGKVKYEQMEFLLEKQKLEGTNKEYKFIVSKRTGDCENKKYIINEEKYYDVQINQEKDEIKEELIYNNKYEKESAQRWVTVIPNTLVEKVWRFTCLYKPEEKQ